MKFKKVYIEITNRCNLRCSFCPESSRTPKIMSIEEFEHILKEIKPYTDYIYLHIKGEPLSHPQLPEFLDLAEKYKIKVNITSNGTLIDRVGDKIINKPAFRQINFSLHSFDGNLDKIDENNYIEKVLNFANKSENIYISLRLWNFHKDNKNKKQMDGNRKILKEIERYFNLDYRIEDKLIPGKGLKIRDKIYLNTDLEFQWPSLKNEIVGENGFCYGLRSQIGILVDGTVIPCCLDGEGVIDLGNIHKISFEEILNGKMLKDIYDGFGNNKVVEELCRRCSFRSK